MKGCAPSYYRIQVQQWLNPLYPVSNDNRHVALCKDQATYSLWRRTCDSSLCGNPVAACTAGWLCSSVCQRPLYPKNVTSSVEGILEDPPQLHASNCSLPSSICCVGGHSSRSIYKFGEAQQFCIQALTCSKLYDHMVWNVLVAIRATDSKSLEAPPSTTSPAIHCLTRRTCHPVIGIHNLIEHYITPRLSPVICRLQAFVSAGCASNNTWLHHPTFWMFQVGTVGRISSTGLQHCLESQCQPYKSHLVVIRICFRSIPDVFTCYGN